MWVVNMPAASEDDSSNNNSAASKLYSVDLTVREGSARLFADVMYCRLEEQDGPGGGVGVRGHTAAELSAELHNNKAEQKHRRWEIKGTGRQ